jgi:regulator of RNase E activity RraA/CMP-N-acetylneuraminic acid synthetase
MKKLLLCSDIDEVYVDSDDEKIRQLATAYGAKTLKRPEYLATNETDGHALFNWEVSQVPGADVYVQALCTAPFVKTTTWGAALACLDASDADSVVLGRAVKEYEWDENGPLYPNPIPNSVDVPSTYVESMSFYVTKPSVTTGRIGRHPYLMLTTPLEHLDINTEEDWELAELVVEGEKAKEQARLNLLKTVISSAMLADVGATVLKGNYVPNLPGSKMFGRARTLHIVPGDGDIYQALQHYTYVGTGDIVMVRNDVYQRAYFGGLNARMAIQKGACGAIIQGYTRDKEETSGLGFPVYSQGYTPVDCKGNGYVWCINEPVDFSGTLVCPGDLIFGDEDGIVHIPWRQEEEIISKVLRLRNNEVCVEKGIISEVDLRTLGEF